MSTPTTPLSQPLYGASFGQAISRFFKKYVTFSGRASRSEYWWIYLFLIIVEAVIWIIGAIIGLGGRVDASGHMSVGPGFLFVYIVAGLWGLAIIIPSLGLAWRRLHDTNRSGGFWFLGFIPAVGWIIVIILMLMPSNPAGSRFDRA